MCRFRFLSRRRRGEAGEPASYLRADVVRALRVARSAHAHPLSVAVQVARPGHAFVVQGAQGALPGHAFLPVVV